MDSLGKFLPGHSRENVYLNSLGKKFSSTVSGKCQLRQSWETFFLRQSRENVYLDSLGKNFSSTVSANILVGQSQKSLGKIFTLSFAKNFTLSIGINFF